jgi:hypothetical protein
MESYSQTKMLWVEEVLRVKWRLHELLLGFETLSITNRSNLALAREYQGLLSLAKRASKELGVFGQYELARRILRRSEHEERHSDHQHAGPWITKMESECHNFLQNSRRNA